MLGERDNPEVPGTSIYNISVSFFGIQEEKLPDVLTFVAAGLRGEKDGPGV